jgi:hypothetical protein
MRDRNPPGLQKIKKMKNSDKTILSLYDYTGQWSMPFKKAGYTVIQQDIKLGQDIFEDTIPAAIQDAVEGKKLHGVLAAVPCTDFAGSGARWWKDKENQPAAYTGTEVQFINTVEMSVFLVLAVLFIVELFNPKFWALENPIGRIQKLVPELGPARLYFDPCDFGDPYTKRTALYGNFNNKLEYDPVFPFEGSKMWAQYGGKSERTKELRSITPMGFAQAFYEANK